MRARLRHCGACDAPGAALICAQCRDAAWCSPECQKADWLAHKGSCRERVVSAEERRGADAPPLPSQPEPVLVDETWHALPPRRGAWRLLDGEEDGDAASVWRLDIEDGAAEDAAAAAPRVRGRVSVVVPTTSDRHEFHAQLWLCYHAQTYTDKELIVIDSGDAPSPFFRAHCGGAPGLTYVYLGEPLSAGAKRNLAISEHSTGEIIANFDDDDLYLPSYLQAMVRALTTARAALVHLDAWCVLDVETGLCGTSRAEPERRCGFAMVYTHAAWRRLPWPAHSSGEDRLLLRGFEALGLPVASRNETPRAITAVHLQHGRNLHASACAAPRGDAAAIGSMILRLEQACRRIIKLPQAEYDAMGGSLLHPRVVAAAPRAEPPAAPRGLYCAMGEGSDAGLEEWRRSGAGIHPDRVAILRAQRQLLRRGAADPPTAS